MTTALITTTLLKYFDICFKLYIKLLRTEHIQNESMPFLFYMTGFNSLFSADISTILTFSK